MWDYSNIITASNVMSFELSYRKNEELYINHLKIINDKKFTFREIDVMASILYNRGEKKIASILDISHRTVNAHVYNIMSKLECNSKDQIIDFLEKSKKLNYLQEYYFNLTVKALFTNQLKKIGTTINNSGIDCLLSVDNNNHQIIKAYLEKFLTFTGINLLDTSKEIKKFSNLNNMWHLQEIGHTHNTIKNDNTPSKAHKSINTENNIRLLFDKNIEASILTNLEYIDFSLEQNFYSSVFTLLKKIIDKPIISELMAEFNEYCQSIQMSLKHNNEEMVADFILSSDNNSVSGYANDGYNNTAWYVKFIQTAKGKATTITLFLLLLFCAYHFTFGDIKNLQNTQNLTAKSDKKTQNTIRSELKLPNKRVLLNRSSIIADINNSFTDGNKIKAVALTGIGGSGKTIIARTYASQSKSPIVWEINAENKETIIFSFEELAHDLCRNDEDKKELKEIQEITNLLTQEKKLLRFVTSKLRGYPEWFLIYDNAESFRLIEPYLPFDEKVWGSGKVIITTRDSNILGATYIAPGNIINLGTLTLSEVQSLFDQIIEDKSENDDKISKIQNINTSSNNDPSQNKEKLLQLLPPFPLDVTTAAYYIKLNKISYDEYIELVNKKNVGIHEKLQDQVLQDMGLYNYTRYNIVSSSIKKIIDKNPKFKELFLLICFINSQDIPEKLLSSHTNQLLAHQFIHELRKYSLISEGQKHHDNEKLLFMHREIHEIIFSYCVKTLDLAKDNKYVQDIAANIENYIPHDLSQADLRTTKILLAHVEVMLNHKEILTDDIVIRLSTKAGQIYQHLGSYDKAKISLEAAYNMAIKLHGKQHAMIAMILKDLGAVYRNLGLYKEAKDTLLESLDLAHKYYNSDHREIIWISSRLGSVYRFLGDYSKAKDYLEKSLALTVQYFPEDYSRISWHWTQLGSVYLELCEFNKAEDVLQKATSLAIKVHGEDHPKLAWYISYLGIAHMELGNINKAIELMEHGRNIALPNLGQEHVVTAWIDTNLGNAYRQNGEINKSEGILKGALKARIKLLGENNVDTAITLRELGRVSGQIHERRKDKKHLVIFYLASPKIY